MALKRDSSCPLCGAKMSAEQLLDACEGIADAGLGVLDAHCPYCQGHLQVRPAADRLDLGYLAANGNGFDAVIGIPCPGLVSHVASGDGGIEVTLGERHWRFAE